MAKKTQKTDNVISSQETFLSFSDSLSVANAKKGRAKVKATLKDISNFDLSKLRDSEEAIYLSGANIEFNIKGDIGCFSTALLNRRFRRTGFAGRNLNLAIPASVSAQDKNVLIDRIGQCANEASVAKVKALVAQGATISMADAKEFGLIDSVIDLAKRRGQSKPTTAKVASTDSSAVDDSKTAS